MTYKAKIVCLSPWELIQQYQITVIASKSSFCLEAAGKATKGTTNPEMVEEQERKCT
jgi:hypothetical protein